MLLIHFISVNTLILDLSEKFSHVISCQSTDIMTNFITVIRNVFFDIKVMMVIIPFFMGRKFSICNE
jgi:hypothetical protein